jgi:hypothetical protein
MDAIALMGKEVCLVPQNYKLPAPMAVLKSARTGRPVTMGWRVVAVLLAMERTQLLILILGLIMPQVGRKSQPNACSLCRLQASPKPLIPNPVKTSGAARS